jgi:hypothetical protein
MIDKGEAVMEFWFVFSFIIIIIIITISIIKSIKTLRWR